MALRCTPARAKRHPTHSIWLTRRRCSALQVIVKEEQQLREPKPRVEVQHVWDAASLQNRASLWKDVHSRGNPNMAITRSKLGMSVPEANNNKSKTKILAERRTRDSLHAMERQREADKASTEMSSPASLFTPAMLQSMRPMYEPNEAYATETTSQLHGLGAKQMQASRSRYNRQRPFPPENTASRNNPDRNLVETTVAEMEARERPWRRQPDPAPPPPLVPRTEGTSFCARPGEQPIERKPGRPNGQPWSCRAAGLQR